MADLSEVLRSKLLPWAQQGAAKRFIVVRPEMRPSELPVGVEVKPRVAAGKRIIVKNRRNYSNVRTVIAEWPADGLHELNGYALTCVLDGFVLYPAGNFHIGCGPGHFIFVPPGVPRADGTRPYVDERKSSTCSLVTFLLQSKALECWISRGHATGREMQGQCFVTRERVIALFTALMEEVIEETVEDKKRALGVSENLLPAFFAVLQREIEAQRVQYIRAKYPFQQNQLPSSNGIQNDFALRLEQYVQANLRKPLTIERAARDMYLSPAQFTRNVRRELGESFNQLLVRHRLEEAKALLRDSDWTISTIAGLTGFRSARYFCTFFKRQTGLTPGEFRAQSSQSQI